MKDSDRNRPPKQPITNETHSFVGFILIRFQVLCQFVDFLRRLTSLNHNCGTGLLSATKKRFHYTPFEGL